MHTFDDFNEDLVVRYVSSSNLTFCRNKTNERKLSNDNENTYNLLFSMDYIEREITCTEFFL